MPRFFSFFLLTFLAVLPLRADQWLTDYDEAVKAAVESKKPLLMNFTGSTWCPPCIMLNKKVFASEVFEKYAKENLVLLKLDFPRPGSPRPEVKPPMVDKTLEQLRKNDLLAQQYQVDRFPTLILVSPKTKGPVQLEPVFSPDAFIKGLEARLK